MIIYLSTSLSIYLFWCIEFEVVPGIQSGVKNVIYKLSFYCLLALCSQTNKGGKIKEQEIHSKSRKFCLRQDDFQGKHSNTRFVGSWRLFPWSLPKSTNPQDFACLLSFSDAHIFFSYQSRSSIRQKLLYVFRNEIKF